MTPAASFRDPAGFCFALHGRILRAASPAAVADLEAFLCSKFAIQALSDGRLISTSRLEATEAKRLLGELAAVAPAHIGREAGAVFEHERVWFPSFPGEWPAEMLHAAAELTLDLAEGVIAGGFGLKDATPDNVLFRGGTPTWVDVLSFERRDPGDPIWKPYAQFVRTFLLPLLAHRSFGTRLADVFTTRRDGLEPEEVYRACGPVRRLLPPFLTLVSLPVWMSQKGSQASLYRPARLADPEKARFVLGSMFGRLRRILKGARPRATRTSAWSDYMRSHSYDEPAFAAKEEFVQDALRELRPARVLDVGANTGHFSAVAAKAGAAVVAIDSDAACVGEIWRRARAGSLNILPLVVDLARPTPALGWRNRECAGFLSRATGQFDAVLMLAVLHHLLVSERIPLPEVLDLAAELTRDALVIEFVPPQDEMFRRIARGRDELFAGLNAPAFETAARTHFEIVRQRAIPQTQRVIYLLRRKPR